MPPLKPEPPTGDDLDADPALTDELRAVMNPRPRRTLLLTAVLVATLGLLAWVASRTELSALWR